MMPKNQKEAVASYHFFLGPLKILIFSLLGNQDLAENKPFEIGMWYSFYPTRTKGFSIFLLFLFFPFQAALFYVIA